MAKGKKEELELLKEEKKKEIEGYSKEGKRINPISITNNIFRSIKANDGKIPMYTAEQLEKLYSYYIDLIGEVNTKLCDYAPSIVEFSKVIGVSTNILSDLKNSSNIEVRTIVEKVYEEIGNMNIALSQMGCANERSTIFKLKSQNEIVEKAVPNVNITYKEVVNTDRINSKLEKYKELLNKKGLK